MAKEKHFQFAEDDDVARARAFWNENGRSIIAGILLGLGGIASFHFWQSYEQSQGEKASILFDQLSSGGVEVDVNFIADSLKAKFQSTAYAELAAFTVARNRVENNDLDAAARELNWVLENTKDPGFQHISRLRLASVLLAQQNSDKALETLQVADKGPFESRYHELMGDAFSQRGLRGDSELARGAYQQSLATISPTAPHAGLIQLKLDNIVENNAGNG